MKVIFCDNHLLIVEKPAGVATQPQFHEEAKAWIKKAYGKPGNVFLEPIHRLDKPVSGLVLFARTSKALSRLNEQMRERKIQKFYIAKVEGHVEESGEFRHFLLHGDHKAIIDPNGKEAILKYKCLEKTEGESLVEIELKTGRYHQIRAQFGAEGHPVVGDHKYGSQTKGPVIALHHYKLILEHPTTNQILQFQSPQRS